MAIDLTNEERETTLSMTADDRDTWHVFSDDPVMIGRLRKAGATQVKGMPGETGVRFTLKAEQVLLRKGKRQLSDETRAAAAARLQSGKTQFVTSKGE